MQPAKTIVSKAGAAITALLWLSLAALLATPVEPQWRLSWTVGLLTLFVGAIVASFSLRYMRADRRANRFHLMLGLLVASVMAVVFAGNLLLLALAWCASGQLLAAMIGHSADWDEARAAARRTRAALLPGDVALIVALGLLAWHARSLRLEDALAAATTLPPALASVMALLLLLAAAARCALPPFSGWLLSSMTAPTPVSALMHAGLVNAGGFLLIRFAPLMEAAPAVRAAAVLIGLCGALYGIGIMMVRPDIKRSLAGSTVSQMGFMIMSCGLGAYAAALWHLIAHGLFKAWLFLGSGSAIRQRSGSAQVALPPAAPLVIVALTLAVALGLFWTGEGTAELVPLLLALATALAMVTGALGGKVPLRVKTLLLLPLVALAALHAGGLSLAADAVSDSTSPIMSDGALFALLAVFLAAWLWQQRRLAARRSLPLPLYVHLMNAGGIAAMAKGELK
jgi:NADH:ubiquinone oxidoreductase subunit 5 (subunit L)/multisubunit Na+/H+ antiporter MnhA subunit